MAVPITLIKPEDANLAGRDHRHHAADVWAKKELLERRDPVSGFLPPWYLALAHFAMGVRSGRYSSMAKVRREGKGNGGANSRDARGTSGPCFVTGSGGGY